MAAGTATHAGIMRPPRHAMPTPSRAGWRAAHAPVASPAPACTARDCSRPNRAGAKRRRNRAAANDAAVCPPDHPPARQGATAGPAHANWGSVAPVPCTTRHTTHGWNMAVGRPRCTVSRWRPVRRAPAAPAHTDPPRAPWIAGCRYPGTVGTNRTPPGTSS